MPDASDERDDFDVPEEPAASEAPRARLPRKAQGGWADPKELPRGPSGRPLCRRCSQEIVKGSGRRTFCSDSCVTEWKIRTQPEFAAELVHARDHGVCRACGRDCDALYRKIRITKWARRKRRLAELGLPLYLLRRRRYWEVDHIQAVVEGGGCCGLENLRTLCWECHKKATRELQIRRGKIRAA
ncbi:MAG TPA: HNH endonuclease signature motif containing protein [Polyangiaceae bacterium]|nr:HNH endonuclease signature motif containing protein [Polyangiaceae bacterium]